MLEQKQKIELNEPALEEVVINSITVKVKPYLKLSDQMALVSVYLEDYFSKEETRVLESEYKLVLGVIDIVTGKHFVTGKPVSQSRYCKW